MVGGGKEAFIGAVHRMAMRLDNEIELVAGAFSSGAEKSRLSGEELFLNPERVYSNYREMALSEARLPPNERIDLVSVVTPNWLHLPVCKTFLEAGFNVVCDKPLALSLEEGLQLQDAIKKSAKLFVLTYNYTGYPLVKEARELVRSGKLGEIQKVVVEYSQDWLSRPMEREGQKQATWRTDPTQAGATGCLGDIGVHAENLVRYITGLEIQELCAEFSHFVDGRELEDDANLLLRYQGGAKGVLVTSQVCVGEENRLTIRVYGTKESLEWEQEIPNRLIIKGLDRCRTNYLPGNAYLSLESRKATRLPAGHPEGFVEAFANIYREAARAIRDQIKGKPAEREYDFPTIDDGLRGMAFLEAAIASARSGGTWTKVRLFPLS